MGFLRYSVLALRILAWVLVASLGVFMVASTLGLTYEREKALEQAHAQTQEMVQRSLSAISIALWQYDTTTLHALLTGFVASPVVVRAEVLERDTPIADVHQAGFTGNVDRVWTLPVTGRDQSDAIGSLRISESYAATNAQLIERLGILVTTDLLKIVGLALVLFTIVYRMVARHLSTLAKGLTALGHHTDAPKLSLKRKRSHFHRDEIIDERRTSDEELRIAACAFESQQGIVITDAQQVILRVNQAFTQITGYSEHEALGQTPRLLSSGRQDKAFYANMTQALESTGNWSGELWNRRKNGEVYPEWLNISAVKDRGGQTTHYVGIFSDLSEQARAQAEIATLAYYDPLTQLPNRRLLLDRLEQALLASVRHARKHALLFVDLDNFKLLNDTLGHHQGDRLLEQVPQRLKSCLRERDIVARWGGDEFVVVLEDLSEIDAEASSQAETVGKNILKAFEQPFALLHGEHRCPLSIGITLFGEQIPRAAISPSSARNWPCTKPKPLDAMDCVSSMHACRHRPMTAPRWRPTCVKPCRGSNWNWPISPK
jgi:diguanylate cyclase (GGDEF)-like protein/PAS domain S-box-containing protein